MPASPLMNDPDSPWCYDPRDDEPEEYGCGEVDEEREELPLFGCACENPLSVDSCCRSCALEMARQHREWVAEQLAAADAEVARLEGDDDSEAPACRHAWVYTGTQYGGDDERWGGEGRCYCSKCGADGDA